MNKKNILKIFETASLCRHFEINACGGFQLSYDVKGLEKLYEIDNEIVTFENPKDLLKKIKYFLQFEKERKLIASNGFIRTKQDHSSEKRLLKLINIFR